jgi:hypothetical protein
MEELVSLYKLTIQEDLPVAYSTEEYKGEDLSDVMRVDEEAMATAQLREQWEKLGYRWPT